MKQLKLTLFIVLFVVAQSVLAQVCQRDNTPQSVAIGNFELNYNNSGGAEIQDKLSSLVWRRCVFGQTWNGTTCEGLPEKLTWQEALQNATNSGWRIPDIKELSSIIDFQCVAPPLHPEVFPNLPASAKNGLWTSTPFISATSTETNAWYVELVFGQMHYRSVTDPNFVLFVKNP